MRIPLLPQELYTSERPSSTAQWTALGRALELARRAEQRIVDDRYAPVFLTRGNQAVLASLRLSLPMVHAVERREFGGVAAFALCRHRFIDEHLRAALDDGVEQVLVLGAGYDSRAYRFAHELSGRPVHEVDLPPLARRKAAIVAAHPELFGHTTVRRIAIDLRAQSLAERLLESGFSVGARTYVAWEGVSPYLTRPAVRGTLETVREICGSGSVLAMDFWDGSGGRGRLAPVRRLGTHAFRLVGEPIAFGISTATVGELLATHGFDVIDLARSDELATRYSTDGRPSEGSLYVVAARL